MRTGTQIVGQRINRLGDNEIEIEKLPDPGDQPQRG
jgi:hypothetical protein